jgi:exopolysaccharide production protein ExoQ
MTPEHTNQHPEHPNCHPERSEGSSLALGEILRCAQDNEFSRDDAVSTNRRLLFLATIVVGAVFFYVGHNFQVSRYERYAPWSDADGVLEAGHNMAKGLALASIGLLGAYLLVRRDGRPLRLTGWLPALMLFYLAWAALSVCWSINPSIAIRRLAVLGFCILAAAGFAKQFRPRDLALMALAVAGAYLFAGVATEIALGTFRPWTPGYRFAGTVHPNTQGALLTTMCSAAFCLARSSARYRTGLWMLFAVGLIFLVLTKSRTACAALAAALAVLWLLDATTRTRVLAGLTLGLLISSAALTGAVFGFDVDDKIANIVMLGRHEESEALTGRIPIWTELLGYIRARPLVGYGYESFWTANHIEDVSDAVEWPLREAHSTFIDAILSVGLIGAGVFCAAVLLGASRIASVYRKTRDPGFAFTLCLLICGAIDACLETGMMSPSFTTLMAGSGLLQLLVLP